MDRLFHLLSGVAAAGEIAVDEWPAVLAAADAHSVEPLLAQRLLPGPLPAAVRERLRAVQETVVGHNMVRLQDFAAAATAIKARGVPVIALKGMHLVPLVYGSLAARAMVDIDLLVPVEKVGLARDALRSLGYEWPGRLRGTETFSLNGHHVPYFLKPGATTIEVHYGLTDPGTPVIDVDGLWKRALPARIGGVDTRVLAVEDLLLHVAVHATYADRCDISARACCDIAQIVRTHPVSWDAVVERAGQWNIAAGTYLLLRLARETFAAAVPEEVVTALAPPDFDERLLGIALRGKVKRNPASPLRYAAGFRGKLRALRALVFPNLDVVADAYDVERNSPFVYGVYLRRAARVARRWREVVAVYRDRRVEESAALDAFLSGSRHNRAP